MDSVLAFYGRLNYEQLVNLTHDELPRQKARGDAAPGAHTWGEITPASMRSYFTARSVLRDDTPTPPRMEAVDVGLDDVGLDEVKQETEVQSKLLAADVGLAGYEVIRRLGYEPIIYINVSVMGLEHPVDDHAALESATDQPFVT